MVSVSSGKWYGAHLHHICFDQVRSVRLDQIAQCQEWGFRCIRDNAVDAFSQYASSKSALIAFYAELAQDLLDHDILPMPVVADRNAGISAADATFWTAALSRASNVVDDAARIAVNIAIFGNTGRHGDSANATVDNLYNWLIADITSFVAAMPDGLCYQVTNGPEQSEDTQGEFGNWVVDFSLSANRTWAAGLTPAITMPSAKSVYTSRLNSFISTVRAIVGSRGTILERSSHLYQFGNPLYDRHMGSADYGVITEMNVQRNPGGSHSAATRGYRLRRWFDYCHRTLGYQRIMIHSPIDSRFMLTWVAADGSTAQLWNPTGYAAALVAGSKTYNDYDGVYAEADPETMNALMYMARTLNDGFW